MFRNNIRIINPNIKNCNSLKRLSLFKNKISKLPKEITELKSITRISLADNYLSKIPDFSATKTLKHLHL